MRGSFAQFRIQNSEFKISPRECFRATSQEHAFTRQAGWHFQKQMSIHNVIANSGATPIIIETGKLAKLADGAVTVRCGETIILVTAVSATKIKEGQDWFPLSVEYRAKAAAVGRFPGGYFKRAGRPTDKEGL